MAVFTIMCIYEIPADNRIEATDRMLEALELHTEEDYQSEILFGNLGKIPATINLLI